MNRSEPAAQSRTQSRTMIIYGLAMIVSLIGLGDSLYLTVQHLSGRSVRCTVTNGCSAVLSSSYSTLAGIPTAAFGVLAYFAAFSLATLAVFGYAWARNGLALLVLPMLGMSLWLVSVQAFKLHAFCEFCLLSAAMTLTLTLLVAAARFFRAANQSQS
ncbi:MAG: vitamin K epoxide reductase family protein [Acidobacteriota bacterium]